MTPSDLDPLLAKVPSISTHGVSPQVRAVEKALQLPFSELPKMIHRKGPISKTIVKWRLEKGI